MSALGVTLDGDWAKAARILGSAEPRVKRALQQAVLQEAHHLRKQIVVGLRSGAPGGKAFKPLSPLTLIIRRYTGRGGGSKPLNATSQLAGSVIVKPLPGPGAFVGVLRAAKGKRPANLAAIHEYGKTIRMTPRMRRFLGAIMRKAGLPRQPGRGGALVVIPARPFIGPVIAKDGQQNLVAKRFWVNMARLLGSDFGTA